MALKQPLLILGGGQLGLMIAEAAARLGLVVDRYDPENACLLPGTSDFTTDLDWNTAMARYAAITVEREAFPDAGLSARLAQSDKCVARGALEIIPDRFHQKTMLDKAGIATAPWMLLDKPDQLASARSRFGDVVVKTRSGGYDGRGTWLLKREAPAADVPLDALCGNAIIEQMIPFHRELSIVGARNLAGETVFYPLVRNWHVDGILRLTLAPAQAIDALQQKAEAALSCIMEKLDFRGVMAVEFFEVENRLLVNEIAPRVHNSGHWSHEGASLSQFALHAIALTDLPMPAPVVTNAVTAMVNLIGVEFNDKWLTRPGVLHWYGKSYRPGRKLGHVNLVASTLNNLELQLDAWRDVLPDGCADQIAAERVLA
jgi:5-(carboxyamino)imidazole ribonucleotide synthase